MSQTGLSGSAILRLFLSFSILILATVGISPSASAQKTDLIYLHNGDRVTGEIKEMVQGRMRISTDAFDQIYVKWEDVERIESDRQIQVETASGRRFLGPIPTAETKDTLALIDSGTTVEVKMNEIVRLQAIKTRERFYGNLDNRLSVGMTFDNTSEVMRWHVEASSEYRTDKYLAGLEYGSLVTNNGTGLDSERRSLMARYTRLRDNRWFWLATGGYQRNDSLGIDGRLIATGGLGRYLVQSTSQELLIAGGLSGNWEDTADPAADNIEANMEGYLEVDWTYFRLHTPKSDVNLDLKFYPSLTESDRYRTRLQVRYRQEFWTDLFWNLTFNHAFDSDPPPGAVSGTDYSVITSLEYLF